MPTTSCKSNKSQPLHNQDGVSYLHWRLVILSLNHRRQETVRQVLLLLQAGLLVSLTDQGQGAGPVERAR